MPYKIVNCFAAGVPVIASRVGAVPTVIRDGENGLLAGEWSEAVRRVEQDEALRERLGRAGRRDAETRFDLEACARQLIEILKTI